MKTLKFLLTLFCLSSFILSQAQVGINNTNPQATLDIEASNPASPANNDGILIPRMSNFPSNPGSTRDGILIFYTGSGGDGRGFYFWDNSLTTPTWVKIVTGNTNDSDWHEAGTSNAPNDINANIFTQGNVSIGQDFSTYKLNVYDNGGSRAINTRITGNSLGPIYGHYIRNENSEDGTHYGIYSSISSSGEGDKIGIHNDITSNSNSSSFRNIYGIQNDLGGVGNVDNYGLENYFAGTGSGDFHGVFNDFNGFAEDDGNRYGIDNDFDGDGEGDRYGMHNDFDGDGNGLRYGLYNQILGDGTGNRYGIYNSISGLGDATRYGIYNQINGSGNSNHYGSRNQLGGTSVGNKYGTYNRIDNNSGGTEHYAVYGEALKSGSDIYAGYFRGTVGIGTTDTNVYKMPAFDGSANQIMATDGAGQVSFVNASSLIAIDRINDLIDGKSDNDGSQDYSSIFLGLNSGLNDDSSDNKNVALGYYAMNSNTTGFENTAIGYRAYEAGGSASKNTAIGYYSLRGLDAASSIGNTAIGHNAMSFGFANQVATDNVAIGVDALSSNGSGDFNIAIGNNALANSQIGSRNVAIGYNVLENYTIGQGQNVAIGYHTMRNYTSNERATAIGAESMENASSCENCTALGWRSLRANTSGIENLAIGTRTSESNTTGSKNVAVGNFALNVNTTGSKNIAIGNFAGAYNTQSNRLFIDSYDDFADANANGGSPLVYGEFDNDILRVNGILQVGNPSGTGFQFPGVDGTPNQVITTNGTGNLTFTSINEENSTASNGLNQVGNDIRLGGTLTEDTSIDYGPFDTRFNLNNSGDFIIQDNGTGVFSVNDVGNTIVGNNMTWRQNSITGTQLAQLLEDDNDGRFILRENGNINIDLRANTGYVFNEQGADRDFRIESDGNANMVLVNAGTNRVGIGGNPSAPLHIFHGGNAGSDGLRIENNGANNRYWRMYVYNGSGDLGLFNALNGNTVVGNFNDASGVYSATSDRRLKKDFQPLPFSWKKLMSLETMSYLYKTQKDTKRNLGLIAQDVDKIYPELVTYNNENDVYHLNYSGFGVIAIKAIQELKTEVDTLKKENDILKLKLKRIEDLEARLEALEVSGNR